MDNWLSEEAWAWGVFGAVTKAELLPRRSRKQENKGGMHKRSCGRLSKRRSNSPRRVLGLAVSVPIYTEKSMV